MQLEDLCDQVINVLQTLGITLSPSIFTAVGILFPITMALFDSKGREKKRNFIQRLWLS